MAGQTDNDILLDAVNQVVKAINDLAIKLEQSSGSCCCCGGDGPILAPDDVTNTPCTPPDGFEDWNTFLLYACRAANWYADKILLATAQVRNLYVRFIDDYQTATTQSRLSIAQVYQRINAAVPEILDTLFRFNLTPAQQANLVTALADRVYNFTTDVITRVPETDTYDDVIYDWFSGPLDGAIAWMQTNRDALIDDIYNAANSGSDVLGLLEAFITDAIDLGAAGVGLELTELEQALQAILSQGVANLKFVEAPAIAVYEGTTVCTGDGGCVASDIMLQTTSSVPYNVLTIGDYATQPGTDQYWPIAPDTQWYFTPGLNTTRVRISCSVWKDSPINEKVGEISLQGNTFDVYGSGSQWQTRQWDFDCALSLGVQYNLLASQAGLAGFNIRQVIVRTI